MPLDIKKHAFEPTPWSSWFFGRSALLLELLSFLVHLNRRLKCTIVVQVHPSSVVNFAHFRLLLWNHWTEFNQTWQEARTQRPLISLCFSGRSEKQDGRPGLWLAQFSTFLWNHWTEFKETWQGARSQCLLPSLCFLGRSDKQESRPGIWLADAFSTYHLKPLIGIQLNSTGRNISTSSLKFVFFGPIGKTRWPSWPLIGWDIFDFS